MIDYLELLLEEQEQEKTQDGSIQADTVFISSQRYRTTGQAAEAVQKRSAVSAEAEQGLKGVFANVSEVQVEAPSSVGFLRGEGALSFALQRQESWLTPNRSHSWATGLYRESIAATRSAAVLRQSGSRVFTVAEPAASPTAPGAAQLDELFARDARRYDNGFFMY